jgi:hypothetical protein
VDTNTKKILENLTRMADEARRILDAFAEGAKDAEPTESSATASPPEAEGSETQETASGDYSTEPQFIPCAVKALPKKLLIPAAQAAISINPANAPFLQGPTAVVGTEGVTLEPMHIALLTTKYFGKEQRTLSVSFMESIDSPLRDKILSHMNAWYNSKPGCGIQFKWTSGTGDVRISRGSGGYWSYLGTDIFQIPKNRQTMNLQGFTLQTADSEFYRVVRHETGHCLSGDTFIDCPRDLNKYPLGIPIKDLVGQQPWVYGWQDGQPVVRKASKVWLSKKRVKVIRVKLKPGQGYHSKEFLPPLELVGTPNHLVLLADGKTWKPLGKLKPGDRLCSLYRSRNGERSRIRWTGLEERVREHVFVCEQVYGPRPEEHDCHHINADKMDQSPENLEWKLEYDHCRDHGREHGFSDKARARNREVWTGRKHTEETRAKMSAARRNQPPMSEETRAKLSAASKGKPQSEELKAKRRAAMERFYTNGGRSGMYGKTASAETRAKRSATMKATLARKKAAKAAQKAGVTVNNHIVASIEQVTGLMDVYDMTVPGADSFIANGVVVHNSWGAPHEHMRKELVERLDVNKTIQWFRQYQGWDQQTVQEQVLTPLDERSLLATPADQTSIMCYQLPGSITKDGKPIMGGTDINQTDAEFAAKIYPRPTDTNDDWDWLV